MDVKKYEPSLWRDYLFRTDKTWIIVITFMVILCGYLIFSGKEPFDWASAILGLIPVIPVVGIWWMEKQKKWREGLPTYLNISLNDPEQEVARFEMIPIQNGIDIRQQAISVLRELINKSHINHLEQFLRRDFFESDTYYDSSNLIEKGKPFELKKVTLLLTRPAKKTEAKEDEKADFEIQIRKGHAWYWCPLCETNQELKQWPYDQLPTVISEERS